MNLYLLVQKVVYGHYAFDSVIVAAENKSIAIMIHPDPDYIWDEEIQKWANRNGYQHYLDESWPSPDNVEVRYIGRAAYGIKRGVVLVVLSSFIAR